MRASEILGAEFTAQTEDEGVAEFRERAQKVYATVKAHPDNFDLRLTFAMAASFVSHEVFYENLLAAALLAGNDRHKRALIRLSWSRFNPEEAAAVGDAARIPDLKADPNAC